MGKRVFIILLLPLAILFWVVGWSLFWAGSETERETTKVRSERDDGVEIIFAPPEEIAVQDQ